jgi:hypothetical protein
MIRRTPEATNHAYQPLEVADVSAWVRVWASAAALVSWSVVANGPVSGEAVLAAAAW